MTAPSKNRAAVALGRKGGRIGGRVTSPAKAAAARANGARGGRPRKDAAATCWACGRVDVRKRPRHGKLFYRHACPHGVPCIAGQPRTGVGGMNGPARGGPCYCPACVEAYDTRARALRDGLLNVFKIE